MIGYKEYDGEHCYKIVCDSMFVSCWYGEYFCGDGRYNMGDYYTFEEALIFCLKNPGRRNLKILHAKEVKA